MNQVFKEEVLSVSSSTKPNLFIDVFGYECFRKFVDNFKVKAKNKDISSFDILLYNMVRGHDPKRGFTDVTNKNKLNNGMLKDYAFKLVKYEYKRVKVSKVDLFGFGEGFADKQKELLVLLGE